MTRSASASPQPLSADAVDGDVVVLSADTAASVALTPEAALATSELLRAAGLRALEQRDRYRRKNPNSGRLPR